jgi:hypothetical protein
VTGATAESVDASGAHPEALPSGEQASCVEQKLDETPADGPLTVKKYCFGVPALALSGGLVNDSLSIAGFDGNFHDRHHVLLGAGHAPVEEDLRQAPLAFTSGSGWSWRDSRGQHQVSPVAVRGTIGERTPLVYAAHLATLGGQHGRPEKTTAATLRFHGVQVKVRREEYFAPPSYDDLMREVRKHDGGITRPRQRYLDVVLDGPLPDGAPLEAFLRPVQRYARLGDAKPIEALIDWTPGRGW